MYQENFNETRDIYYDTRRNDFLDANDEISNDGCCNGYDRHNSSRSDRYRCSHMEYKKPDVSYEYLQALQLAGRSCCCCNHHEPPTPSGTRSAIIFLASDNPVSNNDWIGLGLSGVQFERNNVVIPANARIKRIAFSIRDNTLVSSAQSVTARIFTSPCAFTTPTDTGVFVTITGPNPPNCRAFKDVDVPISALDLLSAQITTAASSGPAVGALNSGVAVSLIIEY